MRKVLLLKAGLERNRLAIFGCQWEGTLAKGSSIPATYLCDERQGEE